MNYRLCEFKMKGYNVVKGNLMNIGHMTPHQHLTVLTFEMEGEVKDKE